jgi:ankyrin repeat protein
MHGTTVHDCWPHAPTCRVRCAREQGTCLLLPILFGATASLTHALDMAESDAEEDTATESDAKEDTATESDAEEDTATESDEEEQELASPIDPVLWAAASQGLPLPNTGWPCDVPTALRLVEVAAWNDWGNTVADLCAILSNRLGCRLVEEFLPRFDDTLLAFAALHGSTDAAATLLRIKACVNACHESGWTPLSHAATRCCFDTVQLLIECKADVDANDGAPLQSATQEDDVACAKRLLEANASVNVADDYKGQTALHFAAGWGNVAIVQMLVDANACVNAPDFRGKTALMYASDEGHVAAVEVLLEAKASVRAVNYNGETALFYPAESNHASVVSALIGAKADVRTANNDGSTPLHVAAQNDAQDVVPLLVEAKADMSATDGPGNTPLVAACTRNAKNAASALIRAKADARTANNVDGGTPLHVAASYDAQDVVPLLLEAKAEINEATHDGDTPLLVAVRQHAKNALSVLIRAKADVQIAHKDGSTPLHVAAEHSGGHRAEDVVALLLEAKAEVHVTNCDGCTPLDLAEFSHGHSAVQMLLAAKSDANRRDQPDMCRAMDRQYMYVMGTPYMSYTSFANVFRW